MSLTIVGTTGYARGLTNEAGMNVKSFKYDVEPEINEKLPGPDGQAICKAIGNPMGKLSIEAEYNSTLAGLMAITSFISAYSVTGETAVQAYFGRTQGGWYVDKAGVNLERDGWRSASFELSSNWNIA